MVRIRPALWLIAALSVNLSAQDSKAKKEEAAKGEKPYTYSLIPRLGVFKPVVASIKTEPDARIYHFRFPTVRGQISDRTGKSFAQNRVDYELAIRFPKIPALKNDPKTADLEIAKAFYKKHIAFAEKLLKRQITLKDETLAVHLKNRKWVDLHLGIYLNVEQFKQLEALYIPELSEEEKEARWGLRIFPTYQRVYPQGMTASHIVGHVGKPGGFSSQEPYPYKKGDEANLNPFHQDFVGKSGIEQSFDQQLRGREGVLETIIDENMKIVYERLIVPPIHGENVILTIDQEWQKSAEEIIEGPPKAKREGAFVIVDIRTGEIVTMASVPNYPIQKYADGMTQAELDAIEKKDPRDPLTSRGAKGVYPPGSVFKVVTALAALKRDYQQHDVFRLDWRSVENIDSQNHALYTSNLSHFMQSKASVNTTFPCPKWMRIVNNDFPNWNQKYEEGDLNLIEALARSCNTWFYKVGEMTGGPEILQMAEKMGLGRLSGLHGIEELPGKLPPYKEETAAGSKLLRFHRANLANISIGQGDVRTTPLQIARMMAAVANVGAIGRPRIVLQTQTQQNQVSGAYQVSAQIASDVPYPIYSIVGNGLFNVVGNAKGTGDHAAHGIYNVAGKTGTAQWGPKEEDRAVFWFAGFIPFEKPRYAFAVMIEGKPGQKDSGGKIAAPLAGTFFRKHITAQHNLSLETPDFYAYQYTTPHLSGFDPYYFQNTVEPTPPRPPRREEPVEEQPPTPPREPVTEIKPAERVERAIPVPEPPPVRAIPVPDSPPPRAIPVPESTPAPRARRVPEIPGEESLEETRRPAPRARKVEEFEPGAIPRPAPRAQPAPERGWRRFLSPD